MASADSQSSISIQSSADAVQQSRIPGFDLARALAYFGMVFVNFRMGMVSPGVVRPDFASPFLDFLEGKAAATFVTLAGVGLALLGARNHTQIQLLKARRSLRKRALCLFLFGSLWATFWPGDILRNYGVLILLGTYFLKSSRNALIAASLSSIAAFCLLFLLLDFNAGWNWNEITYTDFWTVRGFFRSLFFNGFNPVFPWAGFLFFGMWLTRWNWTSARFRLAVGLAGLLVGGAAEALSHRFLRWISVTNTPATIETLTAVLGTGPIPPNPVFMLTSAAFSVFTIAAAVEVAHRFQGKPMLMPLIHTGRMTLTLYIGHVVVGLGGLSLMGRLSGQTDATALLAAFLFSVVSVCFCSLWTKKHGAGPLERFMRWICEPQLPAEKSYSPQTPSPKRKETPQAR